MLEKEKSKQEYYLVTSLIREVKDNVRISGEEPTAKEVLEYMLGDYYNPTGHSDFVVYRYKDKKKRTFLNRLNMLWVYPLFIITIPFQYLFLGDWGINRNTKLGKIVDKLVKFT